MIHRHPFFLPFALCRTATLCLMAALPLLHTAAHAQYSGPASSSGPQVSASTTVTTDRTLLFPPAHDLQLTAGDQISVRLFGQGDFNSSVRIDIGGTVALPLIGEVKLAGLTITQAEELIEHDLSAGGFYSEPQVTVQLTEGPNAVVTVVGEAHGVVPVTGTRRLLDILSGVGGLPGTASHVITIHRPGVPEPIVVDLGTDPMRSTLADIPIFAGDTIVVARIGMVYMMGAFKSPGTIPLTPYSQLSLMQATALSGGPAFEGKYDDLRIIRTVGDRRTVVKVDIKKVLFGKAPDPILEPNDIVFLPNSAIKASISNGSLNTVLSIAGLIVALAYR